MKFFVVGLHCSGKHEIRNILTDQNIKCGSLFSDIECPVREVYHSDEYERFDSQDINEIFENGAYIFLRELKLGGVKFYEGLSKYSFDNNDVFIISPDQLVSIPVAKLPKDVCYVWVDNTKSNRYKRYCEDGCGYDFHEKEKMEMENIDTFIKILRENNSGILYFVNEEPARISAIIYALIQHPDLFDAFSQTFNS